MNSRACRVLLQYGIAFGSTAAALLLSLLLSPLSSEIVSIVFLTAIALTVWYGGLKPGVVAIILSALAVNIFFATPAGNISHFSINDLIRGVAFSMLALMVHGLKRALKESQRQAEQLSQQLLEESSDRLRLALNAAQMGMWDWDRVTGRITWSPEHESLLGLSQGSFDGSYEGFISCLHPDDRDGLNQAVSFSLQHRVPYHHEFRVIWPDGSIHWIEGRGNVFYDAHEQPVRMSGTIMAIDDRKQAHFLLQQQFEQHRLVAEMTNRIRQSLNLQEILQTTVDEIRQFLKTDRVIIFRFSPNWQGTVAVESCAEEWTEILSTEIYDPCFGESYVEPFRQGLCTAKSDIYTADIDECHLKLLSNYQVRANLVVPIIQNNELWGLLIAHHCAAPRQWQDSEIDLLQQIASQVGIALQQADLFKQVQTELSERQQAQEALQESQKQIQQQLAEIETIYQNTPIGLSVLDAELRFVRVNQRLAETNGASVESHIGSSVRELLPDLADTVEQLLRPVLETGISLLNVEVVGETPAQPGIQRVWLESFLPIWDGDRIIGISTVCEEITDRKRIQLNDEFLNRLDLRLRRLSTAHEMLVEATSQIGQYLNAECCVWYEVDEQQGNLIAQQDWQRNPDSSSMAGIARLLESMLPNMVVQFCAGQPVVVPDIATYPCTAPFAQNFAEQDIRTFVAIPYLSEGRSAAVLATCARNAREWHPDTIKLLQEIAARLSLLIEQTQTLELLRESEARLRLAQIASTSAVWDWDVQKNTVYWSPEYYQLYELDSSIEPSYENWMHNIHPDDREQVNQRTLQALAESSDLRVEFRVTQWGNLRWFAGIGQVLRDEAGQPTRMVGITIDIADRKKAEIALQRLNTELERRVLERTEELNALNNRLLIALKEQHQAKQEVEDLYNRAPCGYHSLDAEGVIVRINNTELNWLGYRRDEVLNKMKFTDLVTPESQQTFYQNFPTFIQQGSVKDLEFQLRQKDGSTRWVNLNAIAIKDDAGNFVMSRSSMFDISDRKQAEQTIALQAIITRNMAEGICLVKEDATIVYANPKFEQIFGYDLGELNGQNVSILNYKTQTETPEAAAQSIISDVLQKREATYEIHNVKKDGTPFWCRATCSVFNHPAYGNVLVTVQQDITHSKQAEAALQQQARLEALRWEITQTIRQSLDLKTILDRTVEQIQQTLQVDRVIVYRFQPDWSGGFVAESVNGDWVRLIGSNEQQACTEAYLQETQSGRFQNHETFVVPDIHTADLQPCHVELLERFQAKACAVAPIFLRDTLWGLLAIYQNTAARAWQDWEIKLLQQIASQLAIALQQSTLYNQLQAELQERERATAIIQEAERRWRSLLDNVQLVVVELDCSGYVNYINPFFLRLTGHTESEVLGKNWFEDFLSVKHQQKIRTVFHEVLRHNAHPYYQNEIVTKSGEERLIGWNNTRLQDLHGNVIGTISIGEDITQRQKIDQIKQEFISIVSHELRTPLTSIRGSLGLIVSGVYDENPQKMREMIAIAARQSDRLVRLVNDILDLRRLESGQSKFKLQQCSAADLIQQSVDVMRSQAEQSEVTLKITPTTLEVWADADAIVQVLTNLLSNAIKFSSPNSTVTLSAATYRSPSLTPLLSPILFSIQDEGRGIPSDQLESIFGQFYQVDVSDSREKGGTGLGLTICRTIVEQHGGKIWVESTLERGSTFYFTLPSTQPSP